MLFRYQIAARQYTTTWVWFKSVRRAYRHKYPVPITALFSYDAMSDAFLTISDTSDVSAPTLDLLQNLPKELGF